MDDGIEDFAVRDMRRQLNSWLARKDSEPEQLISWLRGEGLPASDIQQEPYAWVLDGLPLADERYLAETRLATRIARLLQTQPDKQALDERRSEWLYNLLMLCAGLSCPTQLADELHAMFMRRQLPATTTLIGKSLESIRLPQALESALITNQRDARMRAVWLSMIRERDHEYLTGDEYAGFEGIRLMPSSSAARGTPAVDDIGDGLAIMAKHIEHEPDRRVEFHGLIDRVMRTYSGRPTWDAELVHQAHIWSWPDWAVSCLPRMFVPLPSAGAQRTALIWEVYLILLTACGVKYEVDEWLCQDGILKNGRAGLKTDNRSYREFPIEKQMARVTLSEIPFRFVQDISYQVESSRLVRQALRFHSYKTVIAIVIDELSFLEDQLRSKMVNGYGIFTPEGVERARDTLRGQGLRVMIDTVAA
jgi:hypothetical protein